MFDRCGNYFFQAGGGGADPDELAALEKVSKQLTY